MERKSGILVPLFSLRSKDGMGIGEICDLKLLVDLAKNWDFGVIQLLPIYDTNITGTWLDSYCYSSCSMFALNPIYLRIEEMFSVIPKDIFDEMQEKKKTLNQLKDVDYEKVYESKMYFLKKLYLLEKNKFLSSANFSLFLQENKSWLLAYAAFRALKEAFGSGNFFSWPNYRNGTQEVVNQICDPSSSYYETVCFYYFLQFHLHQQLKEAADYAAQRKVFFKGDFPVGVHAFSVETWAKPELFILERRLGAPPDYFNAKGQNWELLAYNWQEMKKVHYDWFIRRLEHMQQYFHLVRIDHILGYFRFWEIPTRSIRGALGFFRPSLSIFFQDLKENVRLNIDRYTEPFITESILQECFPKRASWIQDHFFEKKESRYHFKEVYQKQEMIWKSEDISQEEREFLCELYENVILIEDPDRKGLFYPRIGFEKTRSFKELTEEEKDYCLTFNDVYVSDAEEDLWRKEGLEKLRLFQGVTHMEICVEDLGMIPKCTEEVLQQLGFLRLYIQRMPKKDEEEFGIPSEYEYLSVCSPSNHDTSPLRLWWKEDPEVTQSFYETILGGMGKAPSELTESLCEKIIRMHLESGSKWAIFLLQDLLAMSPTLKRKEEQEERINNPAIYPFYWRWRLHIDLEYLTQEKEFSSFIRRLVEESGRKIS